MRIWLTALFDSLFSLPWRRPTPDEIIRGEAERPIRHGPLHPAKMTMRSNPRRPDPELPPRRGTH